jgi:uncharacterized protein YbaP (TraB family)
MKKKISFKPFFYFFYTFFIFISCSSSKQSVSEKKHFFWEINSGESTVYLLGSIHVAKNDIYPLDSVIETAFLNSNYLAVEFDLKTVDPFKVLKLSTYSDDNNLKDNIDSISYQKIKASFEKIGIPESVFNKYKPWFAAINLVMLDLASSGYNPDAGIDSYFLEKANTQKKKVLELESFEEHIALMDTLIQLFGNSFIDYTLRDLEETKSQIDQLFDYWKNGDVKAMEEYVKSNIGDDKTYQEMFYLLNDKRNFNMLKQIKNYLTQPGKYFIVVGAAHLVGENGLVNLLGKEYKVIQK